MLLSDPVSWSLLAKKTALSYGTRAGHWLWVKGHRPSDHFLPSSISFATFLSCTSCAISPSLASYPNLLPYPHALSPGASPAYSFLGWLFLLGIPKAATGSKVVNETFAEENHLSQPQSSTESLEAGSLKQQVWNSVKTKLILLRLIIHPGWVGFPGWLKHSCQISCFSSKVWDLWDCLKMRLSFFLMWGKLTLVEKSKSILAEIFIYSLRQFLIQAHMHHMYPALGRHLPWKMWALVAEDWQWHQQWKMWSNSRNYQAAFSRWVFPMPP